MDVKPAFFNCDLEEKIYVKQPEDFIAPEKEDKVSKLLKSLLLDDMAHERRVKLCG